MNLRSRSSSPSSGPDEEAQNILQSRLAELYGPIATDPAIADDEIEERDLDDETQEDAEKHGFEFRLFATDEVLKSANGSKANRIRLENDDDISDAKGVFVVPWRDPRYYFTGALTALQKRRFELAAVSGEDVHRELRIRPYGLEVPWRVSVIRMGASNRKSLKLGNAAVIAEELRTELERKKRKRMGKKSRITHRKREAIRREMQVSEQEKLAAEREKKTKRNREKQLKRRAKEKAKKSSTMDESASIAATAQDEIVMGEG